MDVSTIASYAREADEYERGPHIYGGDAAIAGLRAFRAYHPDARLEFIDVGGVTRWMTHKQARIHAVLMRQAVSGEGLLKMREIAAETRCCASTVSRTVLKFQAWGLFGAIVVRGRNGGMYVFARAVGDTLGVYADMARARLARSKLLAMARKVRKGLNVASVIRKRREGVDTDATFIDTTHLSTFARAVLYERARLAYEDPEGEADALYPLDRQTAWTNMMVYAPIREYDDSWMDKLGIDPNRGSGRVPCPAHGEGRSKTLSWKRAQDGRVLIHCFAGCTFDEIRAAVR